MSKKRTLYADLNNNLVLLKNRKFLLPRYMDQMKDWPGKNSYTPEMLDEVQLQIDETEAAVWGIEQWKKDKMYRINMQTIKTKNNVEVENTMDAAHMEPADGV